MLKKARRISHYEQQSQYAVQEKLEVYCDNQKQLKCRGSQRQGEK
jgi:hypothetical protein